MWPNRTYTTHARTHARTHANAHTYTHPHTRTHTHTHAQWANRTYYTEALVGATAPLTPFLMDQPAPVSTDGGPTGGFSSDDSDNDDEDGGGDNENKSGEEDEVDEGVSKTPLAPGAVTLSSLPRAQWQTLFRLELIRLRNKPEEPAKAPLQAPFFLPATQVKGRHPPPSLLQDA